MKPLTPQDELKRMVAREAAGRVRSGQRLGLGSGSTSLHFVRAVARRLADGEISDIAGVCTSRQTEELARSLGIPLTDLDPPWVDLAVDGADEVDPAWNLIKGLGAALLKEKVVAQATRHFLVIIDASKRVPQLGHRCPVPIEVLPLGFKVSARQLEALGARAVLREDEAGAAVWTDSGNLIIDCHFGPLEDPRSLARDLDSLPGVLGHGLFLGMVHEVLVGTPDGVVRPEPPAT